MRDCSPQLPLTSCYRRCVNWSRSFSRNRVQEGRVGGIVAVVLFGLCAPASAGQAAEDPLAPRSFRSLVSEVSQVQDVQFIRELRIEWSRIDASESASVAGGGATQALTLVDERVVPGRLRRERRPQLSYDRLVVVLRDSFGRELDWRLLPNPAIVRAEVPGPNGQLSGQIIELDDVELLITVPSIATADHIHVYQPRWTGSEYMLDSLGQVPIR